MNLDRLAQMIAKRVQKIITFVCDDRSSESFAASNELNVVREEGVEGERPQVGRQPRNVDCTFSDFQISSLLVGEYPPDFPYYYPRGDRGRGGRRGGGGGGGGGANCYNHHICFCSVIIGGRVVRGQNALTLRPM